MKAEYFFFLLSLLGDSMFRIKFDSNLALFLKREDEMKAEYLNLIVKVVKAVVELYVSFRYLGVFVGNGSSSPRCCSVPLPECPEHSTRNTLPRRL